MKIDESESGIDVALTKRYDTLTKMLDVCRQYAAHEVETFEKIVGLRQGMTMAERSEVNAQMDEMAAKLNFVAEQYPQLRSAEVFSDLQDRQVSSVKNTPRASSLRPRSKSGLMCR